MQLKVNPGWLSAGGIAKMDSDNNFISMALKNLPKGKTGLTASKIEEESDQWELNGDGTFHIETYKTVQQTEILAGTKIKYYYVIIWLFRTGNRFNESDSDRIN